MIGIDVQCEGNLDIDGFEVDIECPGCAFHNSVWLKQARLHDVVICRGCKGNIQLHDQMASVRQARRSIREQLRRFEREIDRMSRSLGG